MWKEVQRKELELKEKAKKLKNDLKLEDGNVPNLGFDEADWSNAQNKKVLVENDECFQYIEQAKKELSVMRGQLVESNKSLADKKYCSSEYSITFYKDFVNQQINEITKVCQSLEKELKKLPAEKFSIIDVSDWRKKCDELQKKLKPYVEYNNQIKILFDEYLEFKEKVYRQKEKEYEQREKGKNIQEQQYKEIEVKDQFRQRQEEIKWKLKNEKESTTVLLFVLTVTIAIMLFFLLSGNAGGVLIGLILLLLVLKKLFS